MKRLIQRASALPLIWQIFIPNAAVLVAAIALYALTPARLSYPIARDEAVIIAVGVAALLVVNVLLIRRAVAPVAELIDAMRGVDLLLPGQRVSLETRSAEMNELRTAFNRMLDRLEAERRESGHRTLLAQEDERRRLARGLHDELNQTITGVMLRLRRIAEDSASSVGAELGSAEEDLRALTVEVENIVHSLRPETLDELGLLSALIVLTDQFAERTGIEIERRFSEALPAIPPEAELVVYRVAQGSLTNIAVHAVASKAAIALDAEGNQAVRLTVRDNGLGIDSAAEGNGVRGMRERALLVSADFNLKTATPGPGTELTLLVPTRPGP